MDHNLTPMREPEIWPVDTTDKERVAQRLREKIGVEYEKRLLSDPVYLSKVRNNYAISVIDFLEKVIPGLFSGRILEVGSGTGLYSSHLAGKESVSEVFAVEYSEETVRELSLWVLKQFEYPPKIEDKVRFVIGSFNDIRTGKEHFDAVLDVGSVHHSEERDRTISEIYRVLKTGGYFIGIDRASPNTLTNRELNAKLDIEFSEDFKAQRGFDKHEKVTRRMNSEHDPLLAEWEYLLGRTGFETRVFWIFRPVRGNILARAAWNTLGRLFFILFGKKLFEKRICQIGHLKIPFYPFFTSNHPEFNIIIVARKLPYVKMP